MAYEQLSFSEENFNIFPLYATLVPPYGGQFLLFVAREKRLMGCMVRCWLLIFLKNI